MPSRECAVDFGRISRRLLFRRSCHIIFTFHIFMTECELVPPPKDREKNHAQARRLESSASQCPSVFAGVPCWCVATPLSFRRCVRSGEFAKERGPGGARPRLTSPPSDARPSRPRHSRGPHKGARAPSTRGSARRTRRPPPRFRRRAPNHSTPFKARPRPLRASPHRSVARAVDQLTRPQRLPEPPEQTHTHPKREVSALVCDNGSGMVKVRPRHPRAPCERHRRSSGVPARPVFSSTGHSLARRRTARADRHRAGAHVPRTTARDRRLPDRSPGRSPRAHARKSFATARHASRRAQGPSPSSRPPKKSASIGIKNPQVVDH